MPNWVTIRTMAFLLAAAAALLSSGCRKKDADNSTADSPTTESATTAPQPSGAAQHTLAEDLGLAPGVKDNGEDSNGRHWFVLPDGATRVYDPKEKVLYKATQVGADWKFLAIRRYGSEGPAGGPILTAESLGLADDTEDCGPDSQGRRWFKLPDGSQRVYDPKMQQLFRAAKGPGDTWTFEKEPHPPPRQSK